MDAAINPEDSLSLRRRDLRERGEQAHWRGVCEERARLGCELHDGLLPRLQVATLRVQVALDLLCGEDALRSTRCVDAQEELREVQRILGMLGQETRSWLDDQPSAEVTSANLQTVFREIITRFRATSEGSPCRIYLDLAQVLPPLCARSRRELACIGLEAIRNAVRHGRARRVELRLEHLASESRVRLQVRDDGDGFDPAAVSSNAGGRAHFGLRAMRLRAERLGGRLSVESRPGAGTVVTSVTPDTPRRASFSSSHRMPSTPHLDH